MKLQQAIDTVNSLSFGGGLSLWKPKLEAKISMSGELELLITIHVPHRDHCATVTIHQCSLVHNLMLEQYSDRQFMALLESCLIGLFKHEMWESIKLNGELLRDEHRKDPVPRL